ncbi:hypothetical protein HDU98_002319 [Podochytrium sp. JEL0797]|nr:hypothetical protein HDU98_002319 [Podochytrium sp. JEL0797]
MTNFTRNAAIEDDATRGSNLSLLVGMFQEHNIAVYGTYENPLFKAKEIGDALGIANISDTVANYSEDEMTMLTESGVHRLIVASRKPYVHQFRKFVLGMLKQVRLIGKYESEKAVQVRIQALEEEKKSAEEETQKLRDKHEGRTYDDAAKLDHVYVLSTDKDRIYKIGRTRNAVSKRVQGLQTGCVEDIEVLMDYHTCNAVILETVVHYVLTRYRTNDREHFECSLEHIRRTIETLGNAIHVLRSSYEVITDKELTTRFRQPIYQMEKVEFTRNIQAMTQLERLGNDAVQNFIDEHMVAVEGMRL